MLFKFCVYEQLKNESANKYWIALYRYLTKPLVLKHSLDFDVSWTIGINIHGNYLHFGNKNKPTAVVFR